MHQKLISLKDIRENFEFIEGQSTLNYYSGDWNILGQKHPAETFFLSPSSIIQENQIEQFNLLLENKEQILEVLNQELNRLLKTEEHGYLDKLLDEPLSFSIISIYQEKRDHENKQTDFDIELICSKSYKSFFIKKAEDIVASISNGKIVEMGR